MEKNLPSKCRNILELNTEERLKFLDSFDTIFTDCDGVIWHTMPQTPIEGVEKGLAFLKSKGKSIFFVTNNSLRPIDMQIKKFHENGISVEKSDIYHPARNVAEYLKEIKFTGLIYCLAAQPFKNELKEAGFNVLDGPNRLLEETFQDLATNLIDKQPVKAVVIDVDYNMSAVKLMKSNVYLKDPQCIFIGGAADPIIHFGAYDIMGPGPFIEIVENATKRKATILGKPGTGLTEFLKRRHEISDAKRVVFVGDSLSCDVSFGKKSGFQTLSVLSGGTKISNIENEDSSILPDYYANSLADFIDFC